MLTGKLWLRVKLGIHILTELQVLALKRTCRPFDRIYSIKCTVTTMFMVGE